MHDLGLLTIATKKTMVQGLMMACPMEQELDTCPAKDMRKLPLRERFTIVNQMDEGPAILILTAATLC